MDKNGASKNIPFIMVSAGIIAMLVLFHVTKDRLFVISLPQSEMPMVERFLKKQSRQLVGKVRKLSTEEFHRRVSAVDETDADSSLFSSEYVTHAELSDEEDRVNDSMCHSDMIHSSSEDTKTSYLKTRENMVYISPFLRTPSRKPESSGLYTSELSFQSLLQPENIKGVRSISISATGTNVGAETLFPENGPMLQIGGKLIIFSSRGISAFTVDGESVDSASWRYEYDAFTEFVDARKIDDYIYVALKTITGSEKKCVYQLMKNELESVSVLCTDAFAPSRVSVANALHTVLKIDPRNGKAIEAFTFLGSATHTSVFLAPEAIFVAYTERKPVAEIAQELVKESRSVFPLWAIKKTEQLARYDIGESAKITEIQDVLNKVRVGLSEEDLRAYDKDFAKSLNMYTNAHRRDLEKTTLIQVMPDHMNAIAVNEVPGRLMGDMGWIHNSLIVPTTVGFSPWKSTSIFSATQSDIYVLNEGMRVVGSILGIGVGNAEYSFRFDNRYGFATSSRDPENVRVLDVSSPTKPFVFSPVDVQGTLSCFYSVDERQIVAIAKENDNLKVTLLDVSPSGHIHQTDSLDMESTWSAFLEKQQLLGSEPDDKLLFIPTDAGMSILSYAGDRIRFQASSTNPGAYIFSPKGEYAYTTGLFGVEVLRKSDWNRQWDASFIPTTPDD